MIEHAIGFLFPTITYAPMALLSLAVSFVLIPIASRLRARLGAMDRPRALSIHTRPTPRTGGLAVLAGFLPASWYEVLTTSSLSPGDRTKRMAILAGRGFVALVGIAALRWLTTLSGGSWHGEEPERCVCY